MADTLTPQQRSERMARIKGRDTTPELKVRRTAHRLGFRFRLHAKELPGKPDLIFPRHRVAMFVHGCFWHRHPDPTCKLARMPKTRMDFWGPKLEANRQRDARQEQVLGERGWRVVVIWECETVDAPSLESAIRKALCAA